MKNDYVHGYSNEEATRFMIRQKLCLIYFIIILNSLQAAEYWKQVVE